MRIIFIYPCVSPLFVVEITNNADLERYSLLSLFIYNETTMRRGTVAFAFLILGSARVYLFIFYLCQPHTGSFSVPAASYDINFDMIWCDSLHCAPLLYVARIVLNTHTPRAQKRNGAIYTRMDNHILDALREEWYETRTFDLFATFMYYRLYTTQMLPASGLISVRCNYRSIWLRIFYSNI